MFETKVVFKCKGGPENLRREDPDWCILPLHFDIFPGPLLFLAGGVYYFAMLIGKTSSELRDFNSAQYLPTPSSRLLTMRSLTEEETRTLFTKLAHYTGKSLNALVTPDEDGRLSVFRLQGSRVYYVDKELANLSTSIPRDQLLSMGTQVGKFTKVGRIPSSPLADANTATDWQIPPQPHLPGSDRCPRPLQDLHQIQRSYAFPLRFQRSSRSSLQVLVCTTSRSHAEYSTNDECSEDMPEHAGCVVVDENDGESSPKGAFPRSLLITCSSSPWIRCDLPL